MGLKSLLGFGGETRGQQATKPPSHVCENCGEKYYSNPDLDIKQCRACGGVRVKSI